MKPPIFLFTDFGRQGPYVGQMHGAIHSVAPDVRCIDLMHDAPSMDPKRAAYLLAAVVQDLPKDAIIVAVVDPGVGGARHALLAEADGRRFVGPDNGLLEIVLRRALMEKRYVLEWRPEKLSASFQGRDLFAPAAGMWASGQRPASTPTPPNVQDRIGANWTDDLSEIIYIDAYGNGISGLRTAALPDPVRFTLADGTSPPRARTFSDVPQNFGFWYENSLGLAEVAVNGGSAEKQFGLYVGMPVLV